MVAGENFVNATVSIRIPIDGISVQDDPQAKLDAAVALVERCEAANALGTNEGMTVGWEDMVDGSPAVIQKVDLTGTEVKVNTGDGWVYWSPSEAHDFAQRLSRAAFDLLANFGEEQEAPS